MPLSLVLGAAPRPGGRSRLLSEGQGAFGLGKGWMLGRWALGQGTPASAVGAPHTPFIIATSLLSMSLRFLLPFLSQLSLFLPRCFSLASTVSL